MRLRVLTLNVWGLPWPVGRDVSERVRAIGDALPRLELDVAALQEVWDAGARGALVEAGRRAGLAHAWHNPSARTGGGLLVLSRLPILGRRFEGFELAGLPEMIHHGDFYGGKGFALLTLGTPAGEVALVDTHLQAGYRPRPLDEYVGHRTAQAVELASALRSEMRPLILAGDFNFEEDFEEYSVLTGLGGLEDAASRLGRRQDTRRPENPYTTGEVSRGARIDFLFFRGGRERSLAPVQIERVLDEDFEIGGRAASYSDHAGLRAEFEVTPGGTGLPPVDPTALATARRVLGAGRAATRERRRELRWTGAAALAAAPIGMVAGQRSPISRRRFLGACAAGAGALAGGFGLVCLGLSEKFRVDELRGYDAALRRLDAMAL